jgi:hypothetical protein
MILPSAEALTTAITEIVETESSRRTSMGRIVIEVISREHFRL